MTATSDELEISKTSELMIIEPVVFGLPTNETDLIVRTSKPVGVLELCFHNVHTKYITHSEENQSLCCFLLNMLF